MATGLQELLGPVKVRAGCCVGSAQVVCRALENCVHAVRANVTRFTVWLCKITRGYSCYRSCCWWSFSFARDIKERRLLQTMKTADFNIHSKPLASPLSQAGFLEDCTQMHLHMFLAGCLAKELPVRCQCRIIDLNSHPPLFIMIKLGFKVKRMPLSPLACQHRFWYSHFFFKKTILC